MYFYIFISLNFPQYDLKIKKNKYEIFKKCCSIKIFNIELKFEIQVLKVIQAFSILTHN
jgi:hypothetical protein